MIQNQDFPKVFQCVHFLLSLNIVNKLKRPIDGIFDLFQATSTDMFNLTCEMTMKCQRVQVLLHCSFESKPLGISQVYKLQIQLFWIIFLTNLFWKPVP